MTGAPTALPWSSALVTGASAGIGEAVARGLARRGVRHLVLVARRTERLEELAGELSEVDDGVVVEVLGADLTDPGSRAVVERRLRAPDGGRPPIDLLVNNAGFGTNGPFWELPLDAEQRELLLNAEAVLHLTHAALGGMVERGRGAVLNVSSLAANQPAPGMATYSATKAFVTMFTEGVALDLRGTGVTATAVLPGYTRTEFVDAMGGDGPREQQGRGATAVEAMAPSFVWMTAEQVAEAAIDDAAAGKVLSIPGLGYKVVNALEAPLPRTARRWLVSRMAGLPERFSR